MQYERVYRGMKAEVEFIGALWHAHTHRQERTSCPHRDIPGAALMQRLAGRQHLSL